MNLLRENSLDSNWDLAVTGGWTGPGDSGLMFYHRASEIATFYTVDHTGVMTPMRDYKGVQWSLVVTGGWAGPGNSGMLVYNRITRTAGVYTINGSGVMTLLQEHNLGTAWDFAVTGGWAGPGKSGLLLYNQSAGVAEFYAIGTNGSMTLLKHYGYWRTSWTIAVTGGWAGPGDSGLLLCDQAASVAAYYAVDHHGNMTLLQQYDDSVTGVTFTVIDNHGHTVANVTKNLLNLHNEDSTYPPTLTAGYLAPITAFQLNIVGPGDSETAVLSSGAGSIEYASPSILTAALVYPSCIQVGLPVAEMANTMYGSLPAISSDVLTQSFSYSTKVVPAARAAGRTRPGRPIHPDTSREP
jgi:hypothetical protein